MLLTIDIGNTHTNFASFKKNKIVVSFHSPTENLFKKTFADKLLNDSLKTFKIEKQEIENIAISSVVPKLDKIIQNTILNIFNKEPFFISPNNEFPFSIKTDKPEQVGADRLCNVMAGYNKYGGPLVIVDFGTATNYDIIAENGDFIGGVISPGIYISSKALSQAAAKLPEVELVFPSKVIGTNTIDNMQSGIMYGALFSMEGMLKAIRKELKKKPIVVATGGFSQIISTKTKMIDYLEKSLVSEGIRLIFEYNRKIKK